jgi:hypothetical protein
MKNVAFWDVTRRGSCKNRRLGGTYHHRHQGEKNQRARSNVNIDYQLNVFMSSFSVEENYVRLNVLTAVTMNNAVLWLVVTANVPSSPIFVNLMIEAIRSSETSVHTRAKRRHIPEDGIPHTIYSL